MIHIFVHGFNSQDGGNDPRIVNLRNQFASRDKVLVPFHYGKLSIFAVRVANLNLACALATFVTAIANEPVTLVGHSNGCALIHRALQLLPLGIVQRVVYLSPALDRNTEPPAGPDRVEVWHTERDGALWWARFLAWHEWGTMGRHGYTGTSLRVTNRDYSDKIGGHSDWFEDAAWLADEILRDT